MDENSDKKTGLFGKMGKVVEDLIFENPVEEEAQPTQENTEQQRQDEKPAARKEATPVVPDVPSKVDSVIYKKLKSALEGKGGAFSQFSDMFDSLSEVIADQATRHAAAMKAVGKSYGITLDQILQSLDDSLGVLDGEKEKFSATIRQSGEELVTYRDQVRQKEQAIENLRKQMETLETEKREIERSIAEKSGKIETVRKDFLCALDVVKAEVLQRKDVIMHYLQGGKK